jgi:hypothetical protein
MYSCIGDILLKGKLTPLGRALDIENNWQWLALVMYATPHVSIELPVLESVNTNETSLVRDMEEFISFIDSDQKSIEQLAEYSLDDVYFLAQRTTDKLAIAVYTLYLYGKR